MCTSAAKFEVRANISAIKHMKSEIVGVRIVIVSDQKQGPIWTHKKS